MLRQLVSFRLCHFHTIADRGPADTSLTVQGRSNGTYYYRVAGLFTKSFGVDPGPYSVDTRCVTETVGVPFIVSISMLTNRHALLNCLGPAGVPHDIQGATNLVNWSLLGTNKPPISGTFEFEDTSSRGRPYRFYRLVAHPSGGGAD